jgi:hypothetical protein
VIRVYRACFSPVLQFFQAGRPTLDDKKQALLKIAQRNKSAVWEGKFLMSQGQDSRIASMFSGDRFWSFAAVLLLWLLYAFVFMKVTPYINTPEEFWLLVVGGTLVLLFNTASVIAMVAHLSEARDEIYGLDLRYLDAAKSSASS